MAMAIEQNAGWRGIAAIGGALALVIAAMGDAPARAADLSLYADLHDAPEDPVDPGEVAGAFAVVRFGAGADALRSVADDASASMGCDGCVRPAQLTPELALVPGVRGFEAPSGYVYCAVYPPSGARARPGVEVARESLARLVVRGEGAPEGMIFLVRVELAATARAFNYCDQLDFDDDDGGLDVHEIIAPTDAVSAPWGFEARADI